MSSLGSLWDQEYKQRVSEYNKDLKEREPVVEREDEQNSQNQAFRL